MQIDHVSNPSVVGIFRVQNDKDTIDTEKRLWKSASLLQRAMTSYEPDTFQPEILIRLTSDSPLIRTKIEEIEIEEWQGTTALFAELWGIDKKTSDLVSSDAPLNRTLSIDVKSGKLVGVALVGKEIPKNYSEQLLKKQSQTFPFQNTVIVHQAPLPIEKQISDSASIEQPAQEVINAIKRPISSPVELNQVSYMETAHSLYSALNSEQKMHKPDLQNKVEDNNLSLSPVDPEGHIQAKNHRTNAEVVQSRFKNKRNLLAPKKNIAKNMAKVDPENEEIEWLNPARKMNWKQKKGRDRNLLDLTERIIARTSRNETLTREMIISFLASLSATQLEFMEDLIASLSSGQVSTPNDSASCNSEKREVNPGNSKSINRGYSTDEDEAGTEVNLKKKLSPRTVPETRGMNLIAPNQMSRDLEECIEVSEEEENLHLKILEYQEKHNVSYDFAASMVLK